MKNLLKALVILMGATMLLPATFAMSRDDIPGVSVYGSAEEREELYEIIRRSENLMRSFNSKSISIAEDAIMPVYRACFLEYAETGVLRIVSPVRIWGQEVIDAPEGERGNIYYAKTVTANGLFAGNMRVVVGDGIARQNGFAPSVHMFGPDDVIHLGQYSITSKSYADHAERIRQLLGRDTFVPTDQVRYVWVDHLGEVFYINDGEREALVVIIGSEDVFYGEAGEVVFIGDELQATAKIVEQKFYERMREIAALVAEHGPDINGGSLEAPSRTPNPASIDHIIDIAAFLGNALTESVPGANLPREECEGKSSSGGVDLGFVLGLVGSALGIVGAGVIAARMRG
jgi:hypothetical protein